MAGLHEWELVRRALTAFLQASDDGLCGPGFTKPQPE